MEQERPGATRTASLTAAPSGRTAGTILLAIVNLTDGTTFRAESATDVTEREIGDGLSDYIVTYTVSTDEGLYSERWRDTVPTPDYRDSDEYEVSWSAPEATEGGALFATAAQIAARLGRQDAYEGAELEQVETLIELASSALTEAVDRDQAWAEALEEVPTQLRNLCIEVVVRVLLNPAGARSQSETLGAHTIATSFKDGMGTLELTDSEERRARRAVWGATSGTARMNSVMTDAINGGLLPRHRDLAGEEFELE